MRTTLLAAGSIVAIMLLGCGATGEVAAGGGQEREPAPEETGTPEEPEAPEAPEAPDDPFGDFDREAAREQAESYLGVAEDDLEETGMVRIVRRGEEQYWITMDLRPGRLNLELDDDGSATYVVTRVVVEVPDDEDELVVE